MLAAIIVSGLNGKKQCSMCAFFLYHIASSQLKLVDLDDVDVTLPRCSSTNRCVIRIDANNSRYIPCDESGRCPQYADKLNVFLAWQHFFSLQMYGGPVWLHDKVIEFLNKTSKY